MCCSLVVNRTKLFMNILPLLIRRSEYDVGQSVVLWLERLVQFVIINQSKDLVTSNSQV